jgi:hypothetical protein
MTKGLFVVSWFLAGLLVLALLFVASAQIYQSRRFRACSQELEAAVRSGKTFDSFTQDTSRPDGLMRRYSAQERGELVAHVATRAHTAKDAADVDAMSTRAHTSAVFLVSDMVYILFFDRENRLREFVCLSN